MNWCLWINVLNGYALKTKAIKSIVTKSTYSLFAISVHALSIPALWLIMVYEDIHCIKFLYESGGVGGRHEGDYYDVIFNTYVNLP